MELNVTLDQSDYAACQAFIRQSAGLSFGWRDLLVTAAVGASLVVVKRAVGFEFDLLSAAVAVGFVAVLGAVFFLRARSQLLPDASDVVLGPHRYTIDDSGFRVSTPSYEARYAWSAVKSWPETRDHIFVKLDRAAVITVPKRAFADSLQEHQFLEELAQRAA